MEEVALRMKEAGRQDLILEENEDGYRRGETFRSCHYQALRPLSRMAVLAGFLSLWLKKCVVPSPPRDDISIMAVFPAVDLALGRDLGLLPAMVCNIQRGLRALKDAFCSESRRKKATSVLPSEGRNPRVELPYTYLMSWFAMHCPTLIKPGVVPEGEGDVASVCLFERSSWAAGYVAEARKLVRHKDSYIICRCSPNVSGAGYSEEF